MVELKIRIILTEVLPQSEYAYRNVSTEKKLNTIYIHNINIIFSEETHSIYTGKK